MLGGTLRTAVGIGILGLALSWAFGSNYRFVHWLCVAFGLGLLITAVGDGVVWHRRKPDFINNQMAVVKVDKDVLKTDDELILSETDKTEHKKKREERSRDLDNLNEDELELGRRRREGAFRHVLRIDWEMIVGGMLLLSAGLGLVLGVKPGSK
jgi:hypothetical protein